MLIMTSVIRVGQSKFVTIPIDEDSQERIMNCLQTLRELQIKKDVEEIFLNDTKAAYSKMISAQEASLSTLTCSVESRILIVLAEKSSGKKGKRDESEDYPGR